MGKRIAFTLLLVGSTNALLALVMLGMVLSGVRVSVGRAVTALMVGTSSVAAGTGISFLLLEYDPPLPSFLSRSTPPVDPALRILLSDGGDPAMALLQLRRLRGQTVSEAEDQAVLEALRLQSQSRVASPSNTQAAISLELPEDDAPLVQEPAAKPDPPEEPDPWHPEPAPAAVSEPVDLFDLDEGYLL